MLDKCPRQEFGVTGIVTNILDNHSEGNIPWSHWDEEGLCASPNVMKQTPGADGCLGFLLEVYKDNDRMKQLARQLYKPLRARIVTNAP
eukprot:UN16745